MVSIGKHCRKNKVLKLYACIVIDISYTYTYSHAILKRIASYLFLNTIGKVPFNKHSSDYILYALHNLQLF